MAGADAARLARVIEHLRYHRVLAAGQQLHRHARRHAAGGHAAPEHAAALCFGALGGLKLGCRLFDPLHRKGKWQVRFARRHGQALQNFQQRRPHVAAPARLRLAGFDHVPALERRHRHDGRGLYPGLARKSLQRAADVQVGLLGFGHRVQLVDGKHHRGHAQQIQ